VCPTPKQLNVEIQEIQVNIKRRNYVNQKSKHNWQLGSHKSYRLYLYIFFVVSVFFSFCKGVLVKKYSKKERKKLLPSGPSQKWTSRAATFAEQSVGSSSSSSSKVA